MELAVRVGGSAGGTKEKGIISVRPSALIVSEVGEWEVESLRVALFVGDPDGWWARLGARTWGTVYSVREFEPLSFAGDGHAGTIEANGNFREGNPFEALRFQVLYFLVGPGR